MPSARGFGYAGRMHWKHKARLQNAVARLPSAFSYELYYRLQRHLGGLRRMDAVAGLADGLAAWKKLLAAGDEPAGGTFFEVGTGRAPLVPLAYWLLGARRIITMDLHPYVRAELVRDCLHEMSRRETDVRALFGPMLKKKRLDALLRLDRTFRFDMRAFFDLCSIEYVAPADAARTGLRSAFADYHTSNVVLQHIPPAVLERVFAEGNRIVRPGGLFVHRIDYSDMFSHSDHSVSPINFLRYSDAEWDGYAGNRYMYANRLRHDDYLRLYHTVGHRVLAVEATLHQSSLKLLRAGELSVHARFANKPPEILATTSSWFVSRKL